MTQPHTNIRNAVLSAWASITAARRSVSKRSGAAAAAVLLTAIAPHAGAAICAVSNNTDTGANSLRGCVTDANATDPGAGASNVINATGAQTIATTTGNIDITRSVEIGTGGDALAYQLGPNTTSGLEILAGTSGVHLVLGKNLTLSDANTNTGLGVTTKIVSINNGGNTLDVHGAINMTGPGSGQTYGVFANGDNNAINVSGSITGNIRGGGAIKTAGDQNSINVSGTINVTSSSTPTITISATGNHNTIDISGSLTSNGAIGRTAVSMTGDDNQINVSGSVAGTNSFGIGVSGDNNNIDVNGSVHAAITAIRITSGANNSITVGAGGSVSANSATATAISFAGASTSSLNNYGTITGNVAMGTGASTLTAASGSVISGNVTMGNTGSMLSMASGAQIGGNVAMGNGASTLTMETGAVIGGTADGGTSGNSTLRLIGNGTDRYDGRFTNFQALELNTGGMWSLENNQSYANGINLLNGTLAVNGVVAGAMQVHNGRLQGIGTVGDTTNFAGGTIAPGNSIGTLFINGNYTGSGGVLEIESVLAGTGSPADRLLVRGNVAGTTMVHIINTGGSGALTGTGNTDGISIIQVAGTSSANAFQLAGGYVAAGPYQYKLKVFDPAASAAGQAGPLLGAVPFYDYRLQSMADASGKPVAVPQIAAYQGMPTGAVRYGASLLDSVHQRLRELRRSGAAGNGIDGQQNNEFFLRAQGSGSDVSGNRAAGYDQDIWFTQAGGNVFGRDMEDGSALRIGGVFSYGESKLNVHNSSARVSLEGTSLALTSTYQAAAGWYLDGVAQVTRYSADINTSERGQTGSPDGLGYALSLEGGYPFDLGNGLIVEPQAQLSYQKIRFDRFRDVDGIAVDLRNAESLRGRFGGRIQKTFNAKTTHAWSPFVEASLRHEFLGAGSIRASDVSFASDSLGTSLQLGGGINAQVGANKMVFAGVSYESGLSDAAANAWSGNVGIRIDF